MKDLIQKPWFPSLVIFGLFFVIALIMQVVLPAKWKPHPHFPFVTLEHPYLPFANYPGFQDDVYSWYAFDPLVIEELNRGIPPLNGLDPVEFQKRLIRPISELGEKALDPEILQAAAKRSSLPPQYPVLISKEGIRGVLSVPPKSKSKTRIITMGDSLTFGFGVQDRQTWVHYFGERLKELVPDASQVEVFNAGIISYDSHLAPSLFEHEILPLKPDVLFIGYGFNDYNFQNRNFVPDLKPDPNEPQESVWSKVLESKQSTAGKLFFNINSIRMIQYLRDALENLSSNPDEKPSLDLPFEDMKSYLESIRGKHSSSPKQYTKNIEALIEKAKENHVQVVLLNTNIPSPIYVSALVEMSQKHQVPFFDFRTLLSEEINVKPYPDSPGELPITPVTFTLKIPKMFQEDSASFHLIGDYFSGVEIGIVELTDDGKGADAIQGDGIYSASLNFRSGTILSFRFGKKNTEGWSEEFDGWRVYRRFEVSHNRAKNTPTYLYNSLEDRSHLDFSIHPFMAETCHPNPIGFEIIGKKIAEQMAPTFQKNEISRTP